MSDATQEPEPDENAEQGDGTENPNNPNPDAETGQPANGTNAEPAAEPTDSE